MVKRFDVKTCMSQENKGEFVRYSEYAALERRTQSTDTQQTHYVNLLEKADAAIEAWRDKCQCDCPAELFIPMEELSAVIKVANQHNA